MLSAFPDLFTYGLFAPVILRLALAFFIGSLGVVSLKKYDASNSKSSAPSASESIVPNLSWLPYKKDKIYGLFNVALAILLVIGLFTQVAALITFLVIALEWRVKKTPGALGQSERMAMILAGAIAISLLFSGPGFYAFDLPL